MNFSMDKIEMHLMRLHPKPFNKIKNGGKTSEFRINDEKRQLIKVGDSIEFTNRDSLADKFTVEVTHLKTYLSFKDLFHKTKNLHSDCKEGEFIQGMYQYYTPEEEIKYGVLEIEFKLL